MVAVVFAILLGVIPPLSPGQLEQLNGAYDGRDHLESAFDALLDNVGMWSAESAAAASTNSGADPQRLRGDVVRVTGMLSQRSALAPPHQSVEKWFVRNVGGEPILVFVSRLPVDHGFREGDRITIAARYYKRIDARARDGAVHAYQAFVGAFPVNTSSAASPGGRSWQITLVVLLFVVFLVTLVIARRRPARCTRVRIDGLPPGPLEPEAGLPDDPAEALATLSRRAGDTTDLDETGRTNA